MNSLKNVLQSKKVKTIIVLIILLYVIVNIILPNKSKYNGTETEFILKVKNFYISDNTLIIKGHDKENITAYYKIDNNKPDVSIGDTIKVIGKLYLINNETIPNVFNYKNYANHNNEFYSLNISSYIVINKFSLQSILYKITNITKNKYVKRYLFNEKIINNDYNELNINSLFNAFSLCLLLFKKNNKIYCSILLFLFITTGYSTKIMLLLIMIFFKEIHIKYYEIFFYLILLKIILNPFLVLETSLYYTIIIYITIYFIIKNNIRNKIISTYIINAMLIPLNIYISYKFNIIYFLVMPLYSIVLIPIGFIIALLIFINPLFDFLNIYFNCIEMFSSIITNLSMFNIVFMKINFILLIVVYILLFLILKYKQKVLKVILIIFILIHYLYPKIYNYQEIYFIDVGQGDSTLIRKGNINILIDTGGIVNNDGKTKKLASNIAIFLTSLGIDKIDYLIITHGDFDHAGSAIYLIDNIQIKNIIINSNKVNELEEKIIKKVIKYNQITDLIINDIILKSYNKIEENASSIMTYLTINKNKILLLGDSTIESSEKFIIENKINNSIVKIAHHGSKNNTNKKELELLNPKLAIISVGKHNLYGHPSKEVIDELYSQNIKTMLTSTEGTIQLNLKNGTISVNPP